MFLQAATSRKLLFQAGDNRQAAVRNRTIMERYQNQVIPISEHSAENLDLTSHGDYQSLDDSERAQAWLLSRTSITESQRNLFHSNEDHHPINDSQINEKANLYHSDCSN